MNPIGTVADEDTLDPISLWCHLCVNCGEKEF